MIGKRGKYVFQTWDRTPIGELPRREDVPALAKRESDQLPQRPSFIDRLRSDAQVVGNLFCLEHATVLCNEAGSRIQTIQKGTSQRVGFLNLLKRPFVAHGAKHSVPVVRRLSSVG